MKWNIRTLAGSSLIGLALGCGATDDPRASDLTDQEQYEEISDLMPDGKSDAVTQRVVVKGNIEWGNPIDSQFDTSKYHGYVFKARAGASVNISLDGDVEQRTDTVVSVYGPKKGSSWGHASIVSDDDSGGNRFSRLSELVLPSEGEYLVVAACKNKLFVGKTYRLALGCSGISCELAAPSAKGEIGIEVDFVGHQRFEPGVVELLRDYFASIGYELTIEQGDELAPIEMLEAGRSSAMLRGYYQENFGHRGKPGWHYMVMADYIDGGYQGWGMLNGDVFAISAAPVESHPTDTRRAQANIILHELGHNLGLTHEGLEPELSAGTHDGTTCATAAFAAPTPVTFYSPNCVKHINVNSVPMVE
jgi:hypothetical protein